MTAETPKKPRKKRDMNKSSVAITLPKKIGRPLAFATPEDFEAAVGEYIEYVQSDQWYLPNIAGLAVFLDVSRDVIEEYEKRPEFTRTVKKIRAIIEEKWVQRLGKAQAGGAIFYLKNAFRDNYKDDYKDSNGDTTNIFVLPREIAEKHHLNLPEAPRAVEAKVVEHEEE